MSCIMLATLRIEKEKERMMKWSTNESKTLTFISVIIYKRCVFTKATKKEKKTPRRRNTWNAFLILHICFGGFAKMGKLPRHNKKLCRKEVFIDLHLPDCVNVCSGKNVKKFFSGHFHAERLRGSSKTALYNNTTVCFRHFGRNSWVVLPMAKWSVD